MTEKHDIEVFQDHEIRTIDRGGVKWMVAVDVCKAIGFCDNTTVLLEPLKPHQKDVARIKQRRGVVEADWAVKVINLSGAQYLVSKARTDQAESFARWLGMEVFPAHVQSSEVGVIAKLESVFSSHKIKHQEKMGIYRVDVFFPDYDLIVEIDERGHRQYNQIKEAQREGFISAHHTVIRYDPDSEKIEALYRKIHEHIIGN